MNQSMFWEDLVRRYITETGDVRTGILELFMQPNIDRVHLIREALRALNGNSRMLAIVLLGEMPIEEKQKLFPELMGQACAAHGPVGFIREIIASLPREWVRAHIDVEMERILKTDEYDDYWMLIELLAELDPVRGVNLARRAAANADPDTRELGTDWLERFADPAFAATNGIAPSGRA